MSSSFGGHHLSEFDIDLWNRSAADAAALYKSNKTSSAVQMFPFHDSLLSVTRNLQARNPAQWQSSLNLFANTNRVPAALFPTEEATHTRTFSENGDEILDELDEVWDDNNTDDDDSSSASSIGLMSTAEKMLDGETSDLGSCFSRVSNDAFMQEDCDSGCFSFEGDTTSATTLTPVDNHDAMSVVVNEATVDHAVAPFGTIVTAFKDKLEQQQHQDDEKTPASWDRLRTSMKQSRLTQELLQEHDRKQGLPRSHCVTMMHTNRSRRQLEEGRILPKWNGKPLISKEHSDVDAAPTVPGARDARHRSKKQTTARAA